MGFYVPLSGLWRIQGVCCKVPLDVVGCPYLYIDRLRENLIFTLSKSE